MENILNENRDYKISHLYKNHLRLLTSYVFYTTCLQAIKVLPITHASRNVSIKSRRQL